MQELQVPLQAGQMIIQSLTPDERQIMEELDLGKDINLSGAYFTLMDKLIISPKGWQFLAEISSFSPTARELLEDSRRKEKDTSSVPEEVEESEIIYDDGFMIVRKKDMLTDQCRPVP